MPHKASQSQSLRTPKERRLSFATHPRYEMTHQAHLRQVHLHSHTTSTTLDYAQEQ